MQDKKPPLIVGKIKGVYGVRGWVKLKSFSRPKENLLGYKPLLARFGDDWKKLEVQESQQRGDRLLVKFSGIDTPEDAKHYLDSELAIDRSQLPSLKDDSYYYCDLIGLDVINQDGISLGVLTEILETGANDVMVVKGSDKSKTLIPLIMKKFITKVDLENHYIQVDWQLEDGVSA